MNHLSIVENKKKKNPSLDPLQQKFNQLQKQVEMLQKKHKDTEVILDKHMTFHLTHIQPLEMQMCDFWKEQIKTIYKHAGNRKVFSRQATRSIFSILSNLFYNLSSNSNTFGMDEELSTIFKEVEGISYDDVLSNATAEIQSMVEELFTSKGINVDLTGFNYKGTEEEILQRLLKLIEEQNSFSGEEEPKTKSKKELEKEQRVDQLENLQKKGLNSLYKQLAKAFHPDLEIDPVQKVEKEALMKKLTLAYEEHDLQTLLSLEMQWIKRSDTLKAQPSQDQLRHYNKILQEQVLTLQKDITSILMNPKYFSLHKYAQSSMERIGPSLAKELKTMQKTLSANEALTEGLQGYQAIEIIRNMIYKQERQMERDLSL